MALWQYDFQLIESQEKKISNLYNFTKDFSSFFWKINDSDNFHITIWKYEENLCEITLKNNKISEIYCKLDLRIINKHKINELFKLIKKYNLKILVIEEKIVWEKELLEKIKNSNSLKFLKKWEKYFYNL